MDLRKIKKQTLTCSAPKADEQEELSRFRDFLISRNGLLVFALDTNVRCKSLPSALFQLHNIETS